MLGGAGRVWQAPVELREVEDLDGGPAYPVLTGDYAAGAARWESQPLVPGTPLAAPTPLFAKLDDSVVAEELARLEEEAGG